MVVFLTFQDMKYCLNIFSSQFYSMDILPWQLFSSCASWEASHIRSIVQAFIHLCDMSKHAAAIACVDGTRQGCLTLCACCDWYLMNKLTHRQVTILPKFIAQLLDLVNIYTCRHQLFLWIWSRYAGRPKQGSNVQNQWVKILRLS